MARTPKASRSPKPSARSLRYRQRIAAVRAALDDLERLLDEEDGAASVLKVTKAKKPVVKKRKVRGAKKTAATKKKRAPAKKAKRASKASKARQLDIEFDLLKTPKPARGRGRGSR